MTYRTPSQQVYDQVLRRVHDAQWLLDHVDSDHVVELCMRVPVCKLIHWVRAQRAPATVEQIQRQLEVSRATAYRFRTALADAGERVVLPVQSERRRPFLPARAASAAATFVAMAAGADQVGALA